MLVLVANPFGRPALPLGARLRTAFVRFGRRLASLQEAPAPLTAGQDAALRLELALRRGMRRELARR